LLDIYTLQRSFESSGGIEGKKVVFVGDLARGRTVRSLSLLLLNYPGVKQCFVAPESLQISPDIPKILDSHGVDYELSDNFEARIGSADAIYMTRVQDEWDADTKTKKPVDISRYSFKADHLEKLKPDAVLMHPLPRRGEISPEVDRDPRAVYWRQMRNGMWIRSALMATTFGADSRISDYAAS
jgi:aspartate carbamoyltransferase catalytic subunit